jgi:hypothetical protein
MNECNIGVTWQILGGGSIIDIKNSELRCLCSASYQVQVVAFLFQLYTTQIILKIFLFFMRPSSTQ